MANFDSIVFNTASQSPATDIYGLSAAGDSFVLVSTTGTYAGQTVNGILFNAVAGAPAATVSLSTAGGVEFKVDPQYNGAEAALYLADRSSVLFTILTAATGAQTVTADATTNLGPVERRLRALEII